MTPVSGRHRRTAAATVLVAIALCLAGCGTRTHRRPAARTTPASELVFMQRMDPHTVDWENVAVSSDGAGRVGFFWGETVGMVYRRFRLPPTTLRRLEHLLTRLATTPEPTRKRSATATNYLIRSAGASVQVTEPAIHAAMRPLVGLLGGLIDRYAWTGPVDS